MKKLFLSAFLFSVTFVIQAQSILTIKGATTGTPSLYVSNGAQLNVLGGINVDQAGSSAGASNYYLQNNGTIQISADGLPGQSDFTNNVSGLKTFTTGQTTGEVIFAANSETQSITGGDTVEFMNLTVNNTLSPKVTLAVDVTVAGVLNIGGQINVEGSNLILLPDGSLAGSPYTSGNMIQADSTGQFIRSVSSGAGSFLFPIGDVTPAYSPVTLNFSSNTNAGTVGINLKPVIHPQMNNPAPATDYIKRYWTFSNTGLTTYSYTGNFHYLPADIVGTESEMKVSRWADPWFADSTSSAASDSLTITTSINETLAPLSGDFTGRNGVCNLKTGTVNSARDTLCSGTVATLTVNGSTGNIQWQSSADPLTGFKNITGATDSTYNALLNSNTYFRAYNFNGICSDTSAIKELTVLPPLTITFTDSGIGLTKTFTPTGSSDITTYRWDFGDSSGISSLTNPTHTYAKFGSYDVCLTVGNGSNCNLTVCQNVSVVTGINNISAGDNFVIYPNPFANTFSVLNQNFNEPVEAIEVYDAVGRIVYSNTYKNSDKTIEINLTGLAQAMYLVKIETGTSVYIGRVIKE